MAWFWILIFLFHFQLILSNAIFVYISPFSSIAVIYAGYPEFQNLMSSSGDWLEAEYNETTGELLRAPKGSFPALEKEEEKRDEYRKKREKAKLAQQEYRERAKNFVCKFHIAGNTQCLDDKCCNEWRQYYWRHIWEFEQIETNQLRKIKFKFHSLIIVWGQNTYKTNLTFRFFPPYFSCWFS